jgi:glucan 1,3-beta-glucosidase
MDAPISPRASTTDATMIEVYSARGILIESGGPTWLYGTASEHNVLYQYQLLNAANVWMGHIQSESPYFQPRVKASQPFTIGRFPGDPTFEQCKGGPATCEEAWGLRIINSTDVIIHGAGLYSFFNSYTQCADAAGTCQERLFETVNSQNIWVYNLFTVGVKEVASPR